MRIEIDPDEIAGIRAIITRLRCQPAARPRSSAVAVLWTNAGNRSLQSVSAPAAFGLGDLDNQLAIPHLHVGGLADCPRFLARTLSAPGAPDCYPILKT
jgi:hypothetical protein